MKSSVELLQEYRSILSELFNSDNLVRNWVIKNEKTGQYWSNKIVGGWTNEKNAMRYSSKDLGDHSLPLHGVWKNIDSVKESQEDSFDNKKKCPHCKHSPVYKEKEGSNKASYYCHGCDKGFDEPVSEAFAPTYHPAGRSVAWIEGYKSASDDFRLENKSEYAYNSDGIPGSYSQEYGDGYRTRWNELANQAERENYGKNRGRGYYDN